jgi:hypothetical protein
MPNNCILNGKLDFSRRDDSYFAFGDFNCISDLQADSHLKLFRTMFLILPDLAKQRKDRRKKNNPLQIEKTDWQKYFS